MWRASADRDGDRARVAGGLLGLHPVHARRDGRLEHPAGLPGDDDQPERDPQGDDVLHLLVPVIYRGAVEDLIDGALYLLVVVRCPGEAARCGHLAEKAGQNLCPVG